MNHREKNIIEGLKLGNNWAYKYIYDHYYVVLCKLALTFLKDDFSAQTIVDDLIVNIYEKRETLLITSSLQSYLLRSVKNRCLNFLQLKYEKQEVNFSALDVSDDSLLSVSDRYDSPLAIILENELEQKIRQAIEQLPVECRTVFYKKRIEGKRNVDIAKDLNISVNTVKYHIRNALSRLRFDLKMDLIS